MSQILKILIFRKYRILKYMKMERSQKESQMQPLCKLNWIAIDRRWSMHIASLYNRGNESVNRSCAYAVFEKRKKNRSTGRIDRFTMNLDCKNRYEKLYLCFWEFLRSDENQIFTRLNVKIDEIPSRRISMFDIVWDILEFWHANSINVTNEYADECSHFNCTYVQYNCFT